MSENEKTRTQCENEACGRPAEPGEAYCAACALDRALYFRERRDEICAGETAARRETGGLL